MCEVPGLEPQNIVLENINSFTVSIWDHLVVVHVKLGGEARQPDAACDPDRQFVRARHRPPGCAAGPQHAQRACRTAEAEPEVTVQENLG